MAERYKNWIVLAAITVSSTVLVWTLAGVANSYKNFDGPLYVAITRTWYDSDLIRAKFSFPLPLEYYPAHLPLFPGLIAITNFLIPNPFWAMLTVTVSGAVFGSILFYEIAKNKKWDNPLLLAGIWLFFWPRMWSVRSVGSPETWFIAFIMAALFLFGKGKFFWSGIFGSLALWTKSPGVLLVPVLLIYNLINRRKDFRYYLPVVIMILAGLSLFGYYRWRTGDFWAYFNTGDNIHLGLPFGIFDSQKIWVGNAWLEDVLWVYLVAAVGVCRAWKKDKLWSIWGGLFLAVIVFVSHRDILRYSLPLVPTVILGFSDIFKIKWIRNILILMLVPVLFYTVNFVKFNVMEIADWGQFYSFSK